MLYRNHHTSIGTRRSACNVEEKKAPMDDSVGSATPIERVTPKRQGRQSF